MQDVNERNIVKEVIDDSAMNLAQGYVEISACEGKEAIRRSQIKQFLCNERIAYHSWLVLENSVQKQWIVTQGIVCVCVCVEK